jgi:hypothetical protein
MKSATPPREIDSLYQFLFGKHGIVKAIGVIAASCVKLVKNLMSLIASITELIAEITPTGVPKMILNLAVDILRQYKAFMRELSPVLNGSDPEAADSALFMGKSYTKHLKNQVLALICYWRWLTALS